MPEPNSGNPAATMPPFSTTNPDECDHRARSLGANGPRPETDRPRALAVEFFGAYGKFKTASGVSDQRLVTAAEKSRLKSSADLIVVNTWEAAHLWAFFGPVDGRYDRVPRREVADRVVLFVEHVTRQARSKAEFQLPPPQ